MEPWQIVFISLYGGVLAYLAITQVQQGKMLSAMSAMIEEIRKSQERQEKRVDLFLKTEIDSFKSLIESLAKKQ